MPKGTNQKFKLYRLAQIMLERTDEEHFITMPEIKEALEAYEITADRKSIYNDLKDLEKLGIEVEGEPVGNRYHYHVVSREFELPELKLLVDSVQSSKFITHKKSLELISKIEKLTSRHNAKQLQRQVFVTNRVKTLNERIYYNVDKIHDAIAENKQITFKYFSLDVNKKKVYGKDGGLYHESPVSLTWDDENYYLITYKEKYDSYVHYRVDKMEDIELSEDARVLSEKPFDLSIYSKSMFQMYSGEETDVTIQFENELVGVVYDRFGVNVPIIKTDETHFICNVKVAVSPHFLSWIISFGNRAKIISPDYVQEQLYELIREVQEQYENI